MLSKTSEFTEFNGNFEILNISLGVPEICGQKRPVFRPRKIGGSLKQSRLTRLFGDSAVVQTVIMDEEQNNLAGSIRQSFTKLSNLLRPPVRKFCTICYTFCEPEEMNKIKHCGCSFCKTVSTYTK